MNRILCPDCFDLLTKLNEVPSEEKTCAHGCFVATCMGCGKTRDVGETPFWHCLGSIAGSNPVLP